MNCHGLKEHMTCRACKGRELSMILMPCRHLCLCKDCAVLISACPVRQLMKTASVQVYLSQIMKYITMKMKNQLLYIPKIVNHMRGNQLCS